MAAIGEIRADIAEIEAALDDLGLNIESTQLLELEHYQPSNYRKAVQPE